MYKNQRVSVVLPTYNEKDSIRAVIGEFDALGVVDEILVINNNAVAGTSEEVAGTAAIEIHEPVQGYGSAIRRGFNEATGDLIVVCEPDGTFAADDIFKLLAFSSDVDIVYGSRTIQSLIWEGANMGRFLKWGNWATAKLIEVIFLANSLSDVGCTYRLIRREALEKLKPRFRVLSNFFGPEMIILGYRHGITALQIPVTYRPRVGTSSVTGDPFKAFFLGIQMIILILGMRIRCDRPTIWFLEKISGPKLWLRWTRAARRNRA